MVFRCCSAMLLAMGLALAALPTAAASKGDAQAAEVSALLLKVCSLEALHADEGAERLEAMGGVLAPQGRRATTRHYRFDVDTQDGLFMVSVKDTYCVASIAPDGVGLEAVVRAFDAQLAPFGAERRNAARDFGLKQDDILAAWELNAPGDGPPFIVRLILSASPLDGGRRLVTLARVALLPPPPQAPDIFEVPRSGASSKP